VVARTVRWAGVGTVLAANCLLLAGTLSCQSAKIPANTREVAPGVYHHSVELIEGPWVIHVIEVDLARAWRSGIRLRAVRAQTLGSGLEKTSAMAENAIAGINGDFFYAGNPSHTAGLQIHEGALVAQPRRLSAFGMTSDGRPVVDVFRFEAGLITASGRVLPIPHFNCEPAADGLTFYNRYAQTWQDSVRAAVGYQLQSLGEESVLNDTVVARVIQVRRQVWPLRLARGEWLVAAGEKWEEGETIAPGDTVRLFCLLPIPWRRRLAGGRESFGTAASPSSTPRRGWVRAPRQTGIRARLWGIRAAERLSSWSPWTGATRDTVWG